MNSAPPLAFLQAGFALTPIPLGEKGPRTTGWQRRDAAVFGEENAQRFAGLNAGLVHEWSRTCAIDIDDHDAADEWLTPRHVNIEALLCADDAVSVSSGRANRGKLLYRLPDGVAPLATSKVKDATGRVILEFRCAGSQDVIAGKHPEGTQYSVTGDPATMPTLPDALWEIWRDLLGDFAAQPRGNGADNPHVEEIPEGARNEMLFKVASRLRNAGASLEAILTELHVKNAHCNPSLPESELRTIANSAAKYVPRGREQHRGGEQHRGEEQAERWPNPIDLVELAQSAPQPPQFILRNWLPAGYATLLAGHGGVGKSAIGLHGAVCIALGIPFFGIETARRRVLYLSCEDREQVLHWRLAHICNWLGIDLAELAGELDVLDLVGHDTVLWQLDPRTGYTVTPAFNALAEHMKARQTQVLVVDGVSDAFGGNENARTEVKRFVNALLSLIPLDGALLLLGHVAKPAAAAGATSEGYSGSTQWHNAVRARWYLYPETEKDEDSRPARTGKLQLELQKSNLGRTDQAMTFAWDTEAHMFLATNTFGTSAIDRKYRDDTELSGSLRALDGCAAIPVVVPAATQGKRTAFNVLSKRPEFPESLKRSPKRFWDHIEHLRQLRLIDEQEYRRADGHRGVQLTLTAEGRRRIGEYQE